MYIKEYALFLGERILIINRYTQYLGAGSILVILRNTQCYRWVDSAYIKHYAVFSGIDT